MRIVKIYKRIIQYSEIELKLGIDIAKIEHKENDCLKITTKVKNKDEFNLIYLRCGDLKEVVGTSLNLADIDLKINNKKRTITYGEEEEAFRGSIAKWKRSFKRLVKKI